MIQTAAIIWAVLATSGSIADYVFMRREVARLSRALKKAEAQLANAIASRNNAIVNATDWGGKLFDARTALMDTEMRLRAIERQRSETTRRGNLTRSAKRRAAIASTTEQIRKEIGR